MVKTWETQYNSMTVAYLLEDGHLFRVASAGDEQKFGGGGGAAGRVNELTWDGEVLWDFKMHNAKQLQHHDAIKLPNGNVLMVVWEKKTPEEAIAAGRKKDWSATTSSRLGAGDQADRQDDRRCRLGMASSGTT